MNASHNASHDRSFGDFRHIFCPFYHILQPQGFQAANLVKTSPMKRHLLPCIVLLISSMAHGQSQPDNTITIGKTIELYSNTLHEMRRVMVYLPDSYHDTYFYPRRYPVIYALDGDSHFYELVAMIRQLSSGPDFPEMIIVSIPNTDRIRDLTPTLDTVAFGMDPHMARRTGGGEAFLSFIAHELIPHIDSLYPTAPYRLFTGHSLGGLMVIDALLHHSRLFNAYLAVDPSMMWDNLRLVHDAQTLLPNTDYRDRSLFMATANSLRRDPDTAAAFLHPADIFSTHLQSMFLLRNALAADSAANHLRFHWKYYPEYNHQSVPLPAEYDGLRFLFDFYALNVQYDHLPPTHADDIRLVAHYADISRHMGYTVSPPEVMVNNIAYDLLDRKQYDRSFYFFDLNVRNYPKSFNVYDSMGDYWLARGDKEKAGENFKQALALRENPDTRKKLENIE